MSGARHSSVTDDSVADVTTKPVGWSKGVADAVSCEPVRVQDIWRTRRRFETVRVQENNHAGNNKYSRTRTVPT